MGHLLKLGDLELLMVSDGVLRQDAGAVFGLTPRVMWEPYVPDLDDRYRLPMGLNSMVVRGGGACISPAARADILRHRRKRGPPLTTGGGPRYREG